MGTFLPLKHYMFYCLDRLVKQCNLEPPFLDIGCGIGDLCNYLGKKGWSGKGIDFSSLVIAEARQATSQFPLITIEEKSLAHETDGSYRTIFLWDVIEHIQDDRLALKQAASLLIPGGAIVIAVPSNPREWRWDDEMVGHYRRYTTEGLAALLRDVGLQPIEFVDFTFPVFWAMRRGYTWLKSPNSAYMKEGFDERTKRSAKIHVWHIPLLANILNHSTFIFRIIYPVQFAFRHALNRGHQFIVVARKPTPVL
jgi:SAM-dependent methyltransferase